MTVLDIPEDWTLLSDLARQYGLSVSDILELIQHQPDVQLVGEGQEQQVCRLNP
jgi:hypothetical protein